MEERKTKKKSKASSVGVVIAVVICMIVVFASAAFLGFYFMNEASRTDIVAKPENPVSSSQPAASSVMLANGAIPDMYQIDMNRVFSDNPQTEAAVIERLYKNTDNYISKMKSEGGEGGSTYYTLGEEIMKIDVPSGCNGFNYNRSYYFNNGILYYAHIYYGNNSNELYFNNNSMFRYTGEDGGTVDNAFGGIYYDAIGKFAYNEAYAFYDYKIGIKEMR